MPRKQTQAIIPKQPTALAPPALVEDLRQLITEARRTVAITVNAGLTLLYWRIGKRVAEEVLGKERAAYGRQIVVSLSRQLVEEHGSSFGEKNLRRMIQFAEVFPEEEIAVSQSDPVEARQCSPAHPPRRESGPAAILPSAPAHVLPANGGKAPSVPYKWL